MSAGQTKVEIARMDAAHHAGPALALRGAAPVLAARKRVSVVSLPPHLTDSNEAIPHARLAEAIQQASRKLAHARRLRLSGEKILAAAAVRRGNVYPIDGKLTRREETRHAARS